MSKQEIRRKAVNQYGRLLDKWGDERDKLKAYVKRIQSGYADQLDIERYMRQASYVALLDAALERVKQGYAVDPRIYEVTPPDFGGSVDYPCSSWLFLS